MKNEDVFIATQITRIGGTTVAQRQIPIKVSAMWEILTEIQRAVLVQNALDEIVLRNFKKHQTEKEVLTSEDEINKSLMKGWSEFSKQKTKKEKPTREDQIAEAVKKGWEEIKRRRLLADGEEPTKPDWEAIKKNRKPSLQTDEE